jgi:hypothetical protein
MSMRKNSLGWFSIIPTAFHNFNYKSFLEKLFDFEDLVKDFLGPQS